MSITLLGQAAAQAPTAARVVAAPHYGDTLFHFYQEHWFSAISGLMVSQHFGRVAPHDDEAEVLRGGMLLSFGMHPQAAEVFERLIERQAAPAVRDRAWFFLARIRHQRGLLEEADAALARIAAPLQSGLEEERQLLRAQLLMARQDYGGAAEVLDAIKDSRDAGLYARYNLGVALIKAGGTDQVERGTAMLNSVGRAPGANEELRALRDRANVALGYTALQDNRPRDARAVLQRVRLSGAQSSKALLGYGWAASQLNDHQLALVPWTELATRDITDAAVLEAHIAVPYAMAEIGAYGAALERYRAAVDVFARENRALDESITAIREGKLVQGLLSPNETPGAGGLGAFARIEQLPEMPHATHLLPLMAGHDFQEGYKHLRDLQFLADNLARWQASLGSFADMLDNRRLAFAERLPAVRARSGAVDLPAWQQRRDALAAELQAAEADRDALPFADARERDLLDRIRRARSTVVAMGATPEAAEAAERLRRAAGALQWQLARDYPERSWQARKALRDADAGLARARERDAALLQAQQDEPARHERFARRIAELAARVQALAPQVLALDAEARRQLQDIAVAELQAQKERLEVYAAQAHLAIAQIHDRSQLAQRSAAPAGGAAR